MLFKKLILLSAFLYGSALSAQSDNLSFESESAPPGYDIEIIDDIVKRELVAESPVIQFEPLRESDIAWSRKIWRVIDTREKMNTVFKSPKKPFFEILKTLAMNEDITLFSDETFETALSEEQVKSKFFSLDTTVIFNHDKLEEEVVIANNEIDWESVKQFRVKEVWYFDKEASMMKCRILGISPILDNYDMDTGEFKYALPHFWIYYPQAKEHLAHYRVENADNDHSELTWYDVLENRQFSSFIMKRSNQLDLRTQDQYYGYEGAKRDRLLESEMIKAELFNFEHDLWEY